MSEEQYDFIIVGSGVFGLSTAVELLEKKSESEKPRVLILDAYDIPSPISAANDYNKIIRVEYSNPIYVKLAAEAVELWKNHPVFKKSFFQVGRVTLTPFNEANNNRTQYEQKSFENMKKLGIIQNITHIDNNAELKRLVPQFKDNKLPEKLSAAYNLDAAYGHSANSLKHVYEYCKSLGAEFKTGSKSSNVVKVNEGEVVCEDGTIYRGSKIVVTCGAQIGKLFDMQDQIKVTGLFVSHIKLTDEEYEKYKSIPIFFSAELGYFFPPDPVDHIIKFAIVSMDCTNTIKDPHNSNKTIQFPRYKVDNPSDTMDVSAEEAMRKSLSIILPDLADHELVDCKLCWISDRIDANFIVDRVPSYENVYVANGDSGHGYKFMPNIGKYIIQLVDGKLDPEIRESWKWKAFPKWVDTSGTPTSSRIPRPHVELSDVNWLKG